MTGRDIFAEPSDRSRRHGRLGIVALCIALLGLGFVIGSRTASPDADTPSAGMVTVSGSPRSEGEAERMPMEMASGYPQTEEGAVAAAAAYVDSLDGQSLLEPERLNGIISTIASSQTRDDLLEAYRRASAQARERLGLGIPPEPVVILRTAPVGYQLDRFTSQEATVSVWRVGIVGSGAGVEPQQSWRTQTVTLSWEDECWRVLSFRSTAGPTPPLAPVEITSPGELFASVPEFEEFGDAVP